VAQLYGNFLRIDPQNPQWAERDLFILSKGHAAAAIYAVLSELEFFPKSWLSDYCKDGARLGGHITHAGVPGVEVSTGSLGHGLGIGVGMALAAKRDGTKQRVVVLLSDGECDEGSNWEAFLLAPHLQLSNLVVIIDYNKIQSLGTVAEVMPLEPFADKLRAFRWQVREIDGHDHTAIQAVFKAVPLTANQPTAILAHTVKGKGVSFMENRLAWHYRSPDAAQLQSALAEIDR